MYLLCVFVYYIHLKDVKISAQKIWENLHLPDGSLVIPNNSFVYIATDDPDGVCKDCLFQKKPCESYASPKPVGCPEDVRIFVYLYIILA